MRASGRPSPRIPSWGCSTSPRNLRRATTTADIGRATTSTRTRCLRSTRRRVSRAWHFQLTHHDIWDFDPPTAPILADITADGRPVKAVIQLTKQGFVFVLDRVTGKPVWPIEERPVPKSDVPGEWTSPTQPFPTKPAGIEVQGLTENDLVDFTPEIKAEALRVARQFRLGGLSTRPRRCRMRLMERWAR